MPGGISGLIPLSLLVALTGCEQAPVAEELVRPVRYTRVVAAGGIETRTYSGSTQAELETDLSFKVGGTLISRLVDVGDVLGSGMLVAELDATDYAVRLEEAEARLASAEAELRNADVSYDRTRRSYETRNASLSELDAARANAESAQAQLRAAAQQLEAARLQLSYTRLTAPLECTVAQTFAEQNQNVTVGQSILRVNCGQCGEVVVSVPEIDIGRIVEGMAVTVTIDALPDEVIVGVVREVSVATGGTGTTYPVTIALQERCGSIRSGMAADVVFRLQSISPEGALVVPFVSVGEDRNGRFVFVLERGEDSNYFARRRGVIVGDPTQEGITIASGLTEGELIVTAGVRRLTDGQEVTLLAEPEDPTIR